MTSATIFSPSRGFWGTPLMRSAVSRNALALPISAKDVLRAAVFRNMLMQVFKNLEEEKRDDV